MTIEEATNVTLEDAINTFERLVFSQDFSPSTLRGKAICKIALKALHAQRQSNKFFTPDDLQAEDMKPVRCVECRRLEITGCYGECGRGYLGIVNPCDYCSRGERKEGADHEK